MRVRIRTSSLRVSAATGLMLAAMGCSDADDDGPSGPGDHAGAPGMAQTMSTDDEMCFNFARYYPMGGLSCNSLGL